MTRVRGPLVFLALVAVGCGSRNAPTYLDGGPDNDGPQYEDSFVDHDGPRPDGWIPPFDGPRPDNPIYVDMPVAPDGPPISDVGPGTDTTVDSGPAPDMPVVNPDMGGPTNGTCAKAQQLTLTGGKVSVNGDTSPFTNEYGTGINCGTLTQVVPAPQAYYKVALSAGKNYKISVKSDYYYAKFYLFTGCGVTQINKDCGSGGKTGDVSATIYKGYTKSVIFSPSTSGTYYIAVDGSKPSHAGTFTLSVAEYTKPTNGTCKNAKLLTIPSGGSVTENGDTTGSTNEFGTGINCGTSYYTWPAGQVYYKAYMTAGKTYRVSVKSGSLGSYGAFYIFGTTCTASAINADCGSNGATGDYKTTYSSQVRTIIFKPKTSAYYTIAVDGRCYSSTCYTGSFELTIEDFVAPTNGKCTAAQKITLSGGKATVTGDTTGQANEFGNSITCGGSSYYAADGPQVYYWLNMTAGKSYKISLVNPSFYARFYVFRNSCTASQITSDCGSKGSTGDVQSGYPNQTRSMTYTPSTSGIHRIAVDSISSAYFGTFTMTIEEKTAPKNGTCAGAQAVTLSSSGTTTINGDTTGLKNEFGTQIYCGNYSTIFKGNQAYYRVALSAGTSYTFTLTPQFHHAYLYLFSDSCSPTQINADCGSKGSSGFVSSYTTKGTTTTMTFKPAKSAYYRFAVDSRYDTSSYYWGGFKVTIQ